MNNNDIFFEGIRLIEKPLDTDMGVAPLRPFVVSVSAETPNYEDLMLDLYSTNSKSIPYTEELTNNWARLKPQWRFIDADGNNVEDSVAIDWGDPIYYEVDENGDTAVRGCVGTATVTYIDDLPSEFGTPVMLHFKLNTLAYNDRSYDTATGTLPGFYNNEMELIVPFNIYPIKPEFLHISNDGVFDFNESQWVGVGIKGYATIHGIPRQKLVDYESCAIDYPIIFNYPKFDADPISGSNVLEYSINPFEADEQSPSGILSADFLPFEIGSGIANGGWAAVECTSLVTTSGAQLTGSVGVVYDNNDPFDATGQSGILWASNRTANMIHRIESIYIDSTSPELSTLFETSSDKIVGDIFTIGVNVPFFNPKDYPAIAFEDILANPFELSGGSANYAVAMDGDLNVWTVDYELDRIYKRNENGAILFTKDLQKLKKTGGVPAVGYPAEYDWYGPSSIGINSDGDAIVSLYNTTSAVEITVDGSIGTMIDHPSASSMSSYYPISGDDNEHYLIRPIDVEIGVADDIHILYSNDNYSSLVNYDSSGLFTGAIWETADHYLPYDMCYVEDSGTELIYMSFYGDPAGTVDSGIYYTEFDGSSYTTPFRVASCDRPTYINVDTDKNIWFTYDSNKVGVLPTGTTSLITFNSTEIDPLGSGELDIAGGICADRLGQINVIQSYNNLLYKFNGEAVMNGEVGNAGVVRVVPEDNYTTYRDGDEIKTYTDNSANVASLNAYGDWSGINWLLKYGDITGEVEVDQGLTLEILEGSSSIFSVHELGGNFGLRRQNDSWDMHEQIKSYLLRDYQHEFTSLWDDLIGNIVGNAESEYQRFGRQFYEKIANFVYNNADIDLANIDQIYSIYQNLSVEYDNFDVNYPADMKHWMNILSILFTRLKGDQYQCNRNYMPKKWEHLSKCEVCDQVHGTNLGDLTNDLMEVGTPLVIKDIYQSEGGYDILYPPLSGDVQLLADYGYRSPVKENYKFYEYIDGVSENVQSEGFINWSDYDTTPQLSQLDIRVENSTDWWKSGGKVEQIFTQLLYDGLGYDIESGTGNPSINNLSFNVVRDLDPSEVTIITNEEFTSDHLVAVKLKVCAPVAGYGLPIYTSLSGGEQPNEITIAGGEIATGVAYSDLYIDIRIGDEFYFIPTYTVSPLVSPIIGSGITFERGLVKPAYKIKSAGFLAVDIDGVPGGIPLYK